MCGGVGVVVFIKQFVWANKDKQALVIVGRVVVAVIRSVNNGRVACVCVVLLQVCNKYHSISYPKTNNK